MTTADGGEYLVPFPFYIRAIGMEHRLESCLSQHPLASGYVRGQGNTHADWDNAQINDYVHDHNRSAIFWRVSSLRSSPPGRDWSKPGESGKEQEEAEEAEIFERACGQRP
jgi:hypothetical protein